MLDTEQIGAALLDGDLDEAWFRTRLLTEDARTEPLVRALALILAQRLGQLGGPVLEGCGHAFHALLEAVVDVAGCPGPPVP